MKKTKIEKLMNVSEAATIVCSLVSSIITAVVFTYFETCCAALFIVLSLILPIFISYMIMRGVNEVMTIYLENDDKLDKRLNEELMAMTASTPTVELKITEEEIVKRVKRTR